MAYKYPRRPEYKLRTRRSSAGIGLFTEEAIARGGFIIEYIGTLLDNDEADKKGGMYLIEVNRSLTIDGSQRDNTARYINHSCKPNSEAVAEGKRVFIYAKRAISAGEEITMDYGKEFFDDFIRPQGCKCSHCVSK